MHPKLTRRDRRHTTPPAFLLASLLAAAPAPAFAQSLPDIAPAPTRSTFGPDVLLFLAPGTDPAEIGRLHGMTFSHTLPGLSAAAVFSKSDPAAQGDDFHGGLAARDGAFAALPADLRLRDRAAVAADLLGVRADPRVRGAFRLATSSGRSTFGLAPNFVPNDPLFPPASGLSGQWHLINTVTPGRDVRVAVPWSNGYTGAGVTVGVVDDSVDLSHPDLAPNASLPDSYDFGQNDTDPTGFNSSDRHGTSVAGLIAARGGNGLGVTGLAPDAKLAGLRVDFVNQSTAQFVAAVGYRSTSPALGGTSPYTLRVKNHSYGETSPWIEDSDTDAEEFAVNASAASGTIHVYAAGNARGTSAQDANKTDVQNSPDVVAVAALASSGIFADYSSFGANVFVTAPSSSRRAGELRVTTTDRTGALGYNTNTSSTDGDALPDLNYTSQFGGTSAAAPLIAGVAALLVQARPHADVRLFKHLLARTSDVVDPLDATPTSDGGWKTNAAGLRFNPNYGFGLVNTERLLDVSARFSYVTPLETATSGTVSILQPIPDGSSLGLTRSVDFSATTPLEEVLLTLSFTHQRWGNLSAFVTSPSGTTARAFVGSSTDTTSGTLDWTFTLNQFWGESPTGTWLVNLRDTASTSTGTWTSFSLDLRMGNLTPIPIPEPTALILLLPPLLSLTRRR